MKIAKGDATEELLEKTGVYMEKLYFYSKHNINKFMLKIRVRSRN